MHVLCVDGQVRFLGTDIFIYSLFSPTNMPTTSETKMGANITM